MRRCCPVFSLVTACWLGSLAAALAAESPPSVVLFLVDDMGVIDTSAPFLTDDAGQAKRYPLNDFYALADIPAPAGHAVDGAKLDTLLAGRRDTTRDKRVMPVPGTGLV